MSVEIDGRVIRGLDITADTFRSRWKDLPDNVQLAGKETIKSLLFQNLDTAPRKLHLHPLVSKLVPSRADPKKKVPVWTFHLTPDDRWKASFTFEGGVAHFRVCGKHDVIDKSP